MGRGGDSTQPNTIGTNGDTVRLTPQHRSFERYTTPGSCRAAVLSARDEVWRTGERDTLPYTPEQDTLPTEAVQTGITCGARFTVDSTEPLELRNLFDLSLMAENDARARAVVQRRLALAGDAKARGEVLWEALQGYFDAQPLRRPAADTILAALDSLGQDVASIRIDAHALVMSEAFRRFDPARIRQEANALIAISHTLPADEHARAFSGLQEAYRQLLTLAWYDAPDSIPDLFQRAVDDIKSLPGGTEVAAFIKSAAQAAAVIQRYLAMLGHPAPTLHAAYWYDLGRDTVRPARGKCGLLVRVQQNCGDECHAQYAMLHRLAKRYGDTLQITLISQLNGYSPGEATQPPEIEARNAHWYFSRYARLPFALAVFETPFTIQPDGRRENGETSFEHDYGWANFVLTDRDGKIRMVAVGNFPEPMIDAFIRRTVEGR